MEVKTIQSRTIENISDSEFNTICEALDFLHLNKLKTVKNIENKLVKKEYNLNIIELKNICQKLGVEGYEFS